MKARLRCALGMALALAIGAVSGTTAQAADVVDFPDPSLQTCISQNLQRTGLDPSFTVANLAKLTWLNCSGQAPAHIADLTGIDQLTGLRSLYLFDIAATSLDPLASMTWLTHLVVDDPVLTSADSLVSLTGLSRLWLETPGVTNVSFLAQLPGVRDLDLDVAPGTDLSSLSTMGALEGLIIWSKPGTDLSPIGTLSGLKHLQLDLAKDETTLPVLPLPAGLEDLGISGGALKTLTGLSPGPNVTDLGLWTTSLTSLDGISVLPRVASLYAQGAQIVDTTGLKALTDLEDANLSGNRLASTQDLAGLTQLRSLDLSGNQLADLSGLSGLTNLATLDLSTNRITQLDPLAGLTTLEELSLSRNQITELTALSGLGHLKKLSLSGNQITTLEGVEDLDALTRLDLSGNQIASLEGLPAAASLTQLNVARNQLNDLTPLTGFEALTDLNADDNDLVSLGPTGTFKRLTHGTFERNRLTSIEGLAGIGEPTLDLSDNELTDITPLADVGPGTTLYLARNRLRNLGALPDTVTFYAPDQTLSYPDATVGARIELGIRSISDEALCPIFDPVAPCSHGTVTYPASGTYQGHLASGVPNGPNQLTLAFKVRVGPDRVFTKTSTPTVGGVPFVGTSVQPRFKQWSPVPDDYTYQWYRDGKLIPGPGGQEFNYLSTSADLGHRLSVCVTGHLDGFAAATRCSGRSSKVGVGEIYTTAKPKITGTASTDAVLTAAPGPWQSDAALHYQWQKDHKNIKGQTGATYTVRPGDVGRGIRVRVTGTKPGCHSATRYSATVHPKKASFTAPVPEVSGELTVGQLLTADPKTWVPRPSHLSFAWYRDGSVIKGATKLTYLLTAKDAGAQIRVKATGSKSGYFTKSVFSQPLVPAP